MSRCCLDASAPMPSVISQAARTDCRRLHHLKRAFSGVSDGHLSRRQGRTPATRFAKDQLKSIIERIERLEEEKKTISDDIRDVYAEAKGNGFDVKALRTIVRMRKQDANERPSRRPSSRPICRRSGCCEAGKSCDRHLTTWRRKAREVASGFRSLRRFRLRIWILRFARRRRVRRMRGELAALSAAPRSRSTNDTSRHRGRRAGEAVAVQAQRRIVGEAHRDGDLRLHEHTRASASCRHRRSCVAGIDVVEFGASIIMRIQMCRSSPRRCRVEVAITSASALRRPWTRRYRSRWRPALRASNRADAARDRRARGDDIGALDRRSGRRRIGERLIGGGDAGCRLRVGGGERLAGAARRTCAGVACFGVAVAVAPEAAGIDDVGRRLRLGSALSAAAACFGLQAARSARRPKPAGGPRPISAWRAAPAPARRLGGAGGDRVDVGGGLLVDRAGALVFVVVRLAPNSAANKLGFAWSRPRRQSPRFSGRRGRAHSPSAARRRSGYGRCGRRGTRGQAGHASCAASAGRCRCRDGRTASPRSDRSRRRRAAGAGRRSGSPPAARPG